MLVALINAVKVESVPLNFNYFSAVVRFITRHAAVRTDAHDSRRCRPTLVSPFIRTYDRTVGKLPSIGYNGQPVREPFRVVRPPVRCSSI